MGGMANDKARNLRKNPTEAEKALWRRIRLRQIAGQRFRRQVPIGNYIADFVCLEKRLIVEVDGGQHAEQTAHDRERTEWLKSQSFNVLRFWNHQVLQEIEFVLQSIENELKSPRLDPPPRGGRRQFRK
jgi:very-short-patch-repair endonuclease